jgi:D-psicose/D-tagatose/L-ribulose 3-epimerase
MPPTDLKPEPAMKIGMNLLLWTGHVTTADFPTIAKIKAAGFDGVELPLFDGDAAHYRTIRSELGAWRCAVHTIHRWACSVGPGRLRTRRSGRWRCCGRRRSSRSRRT